MAEYTPKFYKTLAKSGYSSEHLPPNMPESIEKKIRHLERVLDEYEVAEEKGKSKLANDLLETIEELDLLLVEAITEFLESQEEQEEDEQTSPKSKKSAQELTHELIFSILDDLFEKGKTRVSRGELIRLNFPPKYIKNLSIESKGGTIYSLKKVGLITEMFLIKKA